MSNYWFKRKRYGYGWVPVTWQGWAVIAAYVIVVIAGALAVGDASEEKAASELGTYFIVIILASSALVHISYRKGPKPKWRWGRKPGDNSHEDY